MNLCVIEQLYRVIPILLQVERAADDDELKMVFAIDEAASFLLETGFKKRRPIF